MAATAYATNSKEGCENEFAMFIETDPECYLPNLSEYIKFEKGKDGGKNRIALECIDMLVKMRERIQSVEVYYNTHTTELDMKID